MGIEEIKGVRNNMKILPEPDYLVGDYDDQRSSQENPFYEEQIKPYLDTDLSKINLKKIKIDLEAKYTLEDRTELLHMLFEDIYADTRLENSSEFYKRICELIGTIQTDPSNELKRVLAAQNPEILLAYIEQELIAMYFAMY